MVNSQQDSYNLIQHGRLSQESTWEDLPITDSEQERTHLTMSALTALLHQKRYRNLAIAFFFFVITIYLWPNSPSDRLPSWSPVSETEWLSRSEQVKNAFLHAYTSYEQHAWGYDELLPTNKGRKNNFNGWGLTIYDSLSTMAVMNLTSHLSDATTYISEQLARNTTHPFVVKPDADNKQVPFFETTIRYLGSLLSAYALTKETGLLTAADKLGTALLPVFDTPSGLPRWGVDTITGELVDSHAHEAQKALLAEIASCQMEYKYLAKLTRKKEYFQKVDHIMAVLERNQKANGLWPTFWNTTTGEPINTHYSVGAWSDSAYEYLLKQYLMSNHTEKRLLQLYKSSVNGAIDNLVYISPQREFLYVTDLGIPSPYSKSMQPLPSRRFEHLSCFFPGILALGAKMLKEDEITPQERERWQWAAEGIAWGCALMYRDSPTGIGPEEVVVRYRWTSNKPDYILHHGRWKELVETWETKGRPHEKPPGVGQLPIPIKHVGRLPTVDEADYSVHYDKYLLRPETIESVYVLYRTTRNPMWRNIGWDMFQALERYTRHEVGYTSIRDLNGVSPTKINEMPSYALAETWKYLYLLCLGEEHDPLPMERWVFNTEAHPLPVFDWTEEERKLFGIS